MHSIPGLTLNSPWHKRSRTRLAAILIFSLPGFPVLSLMQAATPTVTVIKQPVTVEYRTYPVGQPPSEMPTLDDPLGVCRAEFGETAQCRAEYPQLLSKNPVATVTAVSITLQLKVTIWVTENSGPGVRAHEDAHREIAEYFYRSADVIARRIGESAIGKKLRMTGSNPQRVLQGNLRLLGDSIVQAIHREVYERCKYAEERFDAITDHGRATISVNEGKTRALAEEKAWFASPARP